MNCLSGLCASCGQRVRGAEPAIYVPAGRALGYVYILCPSCRHAVETDAPEKEAVLLAVEQRCEHGRGARA